MALADCTWSAVAEDGLEHLNADGILAALGTPAMEGQIAFWIVAYISNTVKRDVDRRAPV